MAYMSNASFESVSARLHFWRLRQSRVAIGKPKCAKWDWHLLNKPPQVSVAIVCWPVDNPGGPLVTLASSAPICL